MQRDWHCVGEFVRRGDSESREGEALVGWLDGLCDCDEGDGAVWLMGYVVACVVVDVVSGDVGV
jgi:hypothetical protein